MKLFTKKHLMLLFTICCMAGAKAQLNFLAAEARSFNQTWVDLGSNGSAISTNNKDDDNSSAENIGFNFEFNGITYTRFVLNTNGFIKLGNVAPSATKLCYTGPQDTVTGGAIAGPTLSDSAILCVFNCDLQAGTSGNTEYRVYTSGSSPNQVCTIQFKDVRDKLSNGNVGVQYDNISFQIKLYESSNIIEYVYGPFTASANAAVFKTTAVGIRGASSATNDLLTVAKGSGTQWNSPTFQQGNYFAAATATFNNRNNFLPDSGQTFQFVPTLNFNNNLAITNIYSLGRMPVPFANPHVVKVRIKNAGFDEQDSFWVFLKTAQNGYFDSVFFTNPITAGNADFCYFTIAPSKLGLDTLTAYVVLAADQENSNNSKTWGNEINPNAYSYSEANVQPNAFGVGLTGPNGQPASGEFVAKFRTNSTNSINQIRVNFKSNGIPCNIIIKTPNANGIPNSTIWTSGTVTTNNAVSVVSVNPPIQVNGDFFVGVKQTNSANVGFAYQPESPIRDSTFYYDGGAGWTDFATVGADFRFMIEPRLMLNNDVGVIKMVSPTNDSCQGGNKQSLTFQVQNLGKDTINLFTDSVMVYAVVTDPALNTTTYGPVVLNQGKFASNDTMDVTFTNTFDYSVNGDYTFSAYTVMMLDSNQLNDTLPAEIRASTGASAVATAINNVPICPGDTVMLISGQSYGGVLYQWYKDGTQIPGAQDTVWYATAGGKYVCEVANGFGCIAFSDTITVIEKSTPSPTLSVTAQGFCPGDSVTISTPGGNGNYSFQWMNTAGAISGATDSIYYTSTADDYSVLVKDNTTGCSASSGTFAISAFSAPTATVTVNGNTKLCMGDSTELDGSASTGTYFQWYKDGAAISGATNFNYYVTSTGDYELQSITTQGCKTMATPTTITVDSLPTASMTTHTGKNSFCDLDSLQLITPNVSGYTYQWNDQFGPIQGATNNTYTIFTGGDFSVTIINASGCSATTSMVTITTNSTPNADLNAVSRNQFCSGDSERIELTTPASGQTYQWQLNGSAIAGETGTSIYAKNQGDYDVEVTVTPTGCKNVSLPVSISVDASPDPQIVTTGSLSICQGDSVKLEVTHSGGTLQTIDWKKNGTSTGGNGSFYYATTSGDYTVYAMNVIGCDGTSPKTTVSVNPLPTSSFTVAGTVLTANSGSGLSYQWYKDGAPIAGATAITFTMTTHGSYKVEVTDANGCKAMSAAQGFNIGVDLPEGITSLDVYPNPSTGVFVVRSQQSKNVAVNLVVTDMLGRMVSNLPNSLMNGSTIIDLSTQPKGVYLLQVATAGSIFSVRLVKE